MARLQRWGRRIFWPRKKEKLKEKGIEWRSPAELNPYDDYDFAIVTP